MPTMPTATLTETAAVALTDEEVAALRSPPTGVGSSKVLMMANRGVSIVQ
jgi:hypothetical protein